MASKINADEFVDREGEGKPTLPKGVVLSGVTTITTAVVAENEVANSTGINAGIITSTHFAGNLTGDVNAGIVTVTSQTVVGSAVTISASGIDIGAGVITATSYAGSGANLTGIGATIMVWEYNPDPGDTDVTVGTGIGITFNQKIKAGSGNITLSIANAGVAGTVVENFGIGSSVTIAGNELSLTPTANLTDGGDYIISYPSGVFTNMAGENYVGTAYTFQTKPVFYQAWIWGHNEQGQLGQNIGGNPGSTSSPVQIPGSNWSGIEANKAGTIAVTTLGTLYIWGRNNSGQLGQNNEVSYSSPVQIPGTTWSTAADTMDGSEEGRTFAIKTNGTLWCWGNNNNGNLGLNAPNNERYSSPVQIPGTTWSNISVGAELQLATKTDGTLWAWGFNYDGQLAQNESYSPSKKARSSPTQIPGTTWSTGENKISVASGKAYAIKTDGTLWGWGSNSYGALGTNQAHSLRISSPVQVPGTTWTAVTGGSNPLAKKTDNTLWSWGYNFRGEVGQNHRIYYSSPVQVPGTTWSKTSSATNGHYAIKEA